MTALPLPPDPEDMNNDRSAWAEYALTAFMSQTGADRDEALSDLLADLMHWCDRRPASFDHELERARHHYLAETLGEPDDQPATERN